LFGERKIDTNKTNKEVKNSNRNKSKNGQRKRRTTTIKNEEKNKLGEDITQMKVAAVDKNMTLVATFIIIIMIIIKLFCVLCKSLSGPAEGNDRKT